jgi:acetylornithine/LysW-gamma-L-lysine aminotransferase
LITCYSGFYNDKRAEAAKKLVEISPENIKKIFFCNSGTESVEAAIKFARSTTKKPKIIALMRGYHGKTIGSLSLTWNKKYQLPFKPIMQGTEHVPAGNIEKLKEAIDENTAAVIIELVQGEGGVRPLEKEYIQEVRKITQENNILLIVDEVQTGFGRTGKMFCCENYNLKPDIICSSKAIAGGLAMGATLCSENIEVPKKSHTSTFGGNALACEASLATIDYMEKNNLAKNSEEMGNYFMQKLKEINSDKIREVRGMGLMIGVELKERAGFYVNQLMKEGIVALLAGSTVIRFLPPLIVTKEEIDRALEALQKVLEINP